MPTRSVLNLENSFLEILIHYGDMLPLISAIYVPKSTFSTFRMFTLL